jgi:hypothetical protein
MEGKRNKIRKHEECRIKNAECRRHNAELGMQN